MVGLPALPENLLFLFLFQNDAFPGSRFFEKGKLVLDKEALRYNNGIVL